MPKSEGEHIVEGTKLGYANNYAYPLKMCKVNIGLEENPKFTNIRDYWNGVTVETIVSTQI